jgi:hypothetical protein
VKFFSLKKDNSTKEVQRTHKIKISWWWKLWNDNNLVVDTLKNHSQFQKCGTLKLWEFKVCPFQISKFQNFKSALPHIMGYNEHDVLNKILFYIALNSKFKN